MNEAIPQVQPTATIEVDDLDQFVKLLTGWHSQKIKVLEHFLQVPDGTEMQVGEDAPITLTGNVLVGVKAGIQLALMELGHLPFMAEMEVTAPAPA